MFIPAGSVVDGWAFVGASSRLGQITRTGPVSGAVWSIPMTGTWIYEEDAYAFFEQTERVYCTRSQSYIEIHPVLALAPSIDQYQTKPEGVL